MWESTASNQLLRTRPALVRNCGTVVRTSEKGPGVTHGAQPLPALRSLLPPAGTLPPPTLKSAKSMINAFPVHMNTSSLTWCEMIQPSCDVVNTAAAAVAA